jgi:hypothetical protein
MTIDISIDRIKNDSNIPDHQKDFLDIPLPNPFFFDKNDVKAIILGADPSNFSNYGKPLLLSTVFGIGSDPRYFRGILKNLNIIGLHLEDIYVQNVVQNYMSDETGKNKYWEVFAIHWMQNLREELKLFDNTESIPVLVTAERIMKFLVKDEKFIGNARSLYSQKACPIPKEVSKLNRALIAFYRHNVYKLSRKQIYADSLKSFFTKTSK